MEIGAEIKRLRLMYGLTQEELANRTELTKGYISQLERDLTSPSIATLKDILSCLGTTLTDFFNENKQETVVFSNQDTCVQTDEEQHIVIRWLIPNAQKNTMEPILIELSPGGGTLMQDPHEGEEFGYVLSGNVVLHLGQRRLKVKKGESFYFKPDKAHSLQNESSRPAKVLWIAQPPSF